MIAEVLLNVLTIPRGPESESLSVDRVNLSCLLSMKLVFSSCIPCVCPTLVISKDKSDWYLGGDVHERKNATTYYLSGCTSTIFSIASERNRFYRSLPHRLTWGYRYTMFLFKLLCSGWFYLCSDPLILPSTLSAWSRMNVSDCLLGPLLLIHLTQVSNIALMLLWVLVAGVL